MYTRGRFLSRISPFDLLEELPQGRRRGFVLEGLALVNDGTEGTLISRRVSDDWYHLRYLTWFEDPQGTAESDNRVTLRANGSPIGENFQTLIVPYIGRRHRIRVWGLIPPLSLFELLYLNNSGFNHTPQVIVSGFRSKYPNALDSEGP